MSTDSYYTEGYIKTIDLTDNKMTFTLDPIAAFTFEGEVKGKEKTKKVLVVKKECESEKEKLTVVCSMEQSDLCIKKCGWICSNTLVTLKAAKCKIRVFFEEGKYSEVTRLEVL